MFGDTFDTVEDILNPTTTIFQTRKAQNCADYLELPELPRIKHFAGLKNQGATCYLNSLIQSYYMSPEFRKVILSLPLCYETIQQSADLTKNKSRNQFLLEFQKLFIQLQQLQSRATSTEPLTQSFGWNDGEQLYQQDVAEANKVLFQTLDRSLSGTNFVLSNYYQGKLFHHITCLNCENSHGNEEIFYDLNIQVQGNTNLQEALFKCIEPELLNEGNQYLCELCGFKVDALKGVKIRTLPPIVTITLNRYTYDYEKNQRVKLNDRFEFPLEIEMGMYLENPQDNLMYELQGVLIHRGSAYGGHYHAYFRDLLNEGDWQNQIKEYQNEKGAQQTIQQGEQLAFQIQNPAVAEGWYNFNDNTVTPITVDKIQEQFQGAESAYILIYRDKNLKPQKLEKEQIPKYLIDYVQEQNQKIEQDRLFYEEEKQHIILKVSDASILDIENHTLVFEKYDSTSYKLKLSTPVSQLYQQINKEGYVLLEFIEIYQTKLLHFPRYLQNSEKTLEEEKVSHESTFILVKENINLSQVGEFKVPIKLNFIINKKPQSFLQYTSTTLVELKELIFSLSGLTPDEQQLKLTSNQKVISDMPDETKLGELQLNVETQILVQKKVDQTANVKQDSKKPQQLDDDITSIIVEREEDATVNRFYVNINSTISELIDFIKEQLGLNDVRRLRNMNGRTLFCKSDLEIKLKEIQDFREGGARLQLERGDIPESGQISLQIQYGENEYFMVTIDPRVDQIQHVKKLVCEKFQLNIDNYRLYKVDWLQVPSEAIVDETKTISSCYLRDRDLLILCDKQANIDCELIRFQLFSTKTGYPDDSVFQKHETIRRDSTLRQLKEMIISTFNLNIQIDHLRVRDINKNRFFGQVFRNLDQPLRKFNFSTNDIVYQILDKPEQLNDDEILLLIKERDVQNKVYINQREFVFKASKLPKLQDLKDQIRASVGIDQNIQLELAKFVVFEFQWMHLDLNSLQNAQQNKGKQGKKQSKQQDNQKQANNKQQPQIVDNLRKHPISLQEGDFIGYRLGDFSKDDFQTKEDNELRERMIAARKNKHDQFGKSKRIQNEKGFTVDIE